MAWTGPEVAWTGPKVAWTGPKVAWTGPQVAWTGPKVTRMHPMRAPVGSGQSLDEDPKGVWTAKVVPKWL